MAICKVDDCERNSCSRGWCLRHYKRWLRHGDPLAGQRFRDNVPVVPPEERFWPKVDKSDDCWEWTAGLFPDGYGSFRYNGVMTGSHRVSYEWAYGPIPDGMQVDHICRNRKCVRPEHLRLVTHAQNRQNHGGAMRTNKTSGVRGVSWYPQTNRWVVHVAHKTVGYFQDLAEAEAAAIAERNRVYTHNDLDRV